LKEEHLICKVTEKTDGFAFEVGGDEQGFYCRSASSPKMRKQGDFNYWCWYNYPTDQTSIIPIRLELAFASMRSCHRMVDTLIREKVSMKGEMIIAMDGKPYTPNGTQYDPFKLGLQATFIEHTQLNTYDIEKFNIRHWAPLNYYVYFYDDIHPLIYDVKLPIKKFTENISWHLYDQYSEQLKIHEASENVLTELKKLLPQKSKWGDCSPEGWVFHLPSGRKFKIMTEKINGNN